MIFRMYKAVEPPITLKSLTSVANDAPSGLNESEFNTGSSNAMVSEDWINSPKWKEGGTVLFDHKTYR